MKLATETITLFHYRYDPESGYDVWTPTVIRGVSYYGDTATTVNDTGLLAASRFTVRIPENADTGGKEYVTPLDFTDPETQWSVATGDALIKGEVEGNDWTPEKLQAAYGEIVTVVGVADNGRGRMKHWKITGK